MQGATALVAPSRSEGFGLPVLEAFAAGVPVICSDAPALVELSGGAALVVPREDPAALAEALGSLLADPDEGVGDAGARRAQGGGLQLGIGRAAAVGAASSGSVTRRPSVPGDPGGISLGGGATCP